MVPRDAIAGHEGLGGLAYFLELFGLPVALLVVILWAMLKVAKWTAPRIDRLLTRHEELLDRMEMELVGHGEILGEMQETQRRTLQVLEELRNRLPSPG